MNEDIFNVLAQNGVDIPSAQRKAIAERIKDPSTRKRFYDAHANKAFKTYEEFENAYNNKPTAAPQVAPQQTQQVDDGPSVVNGGVAISDSQLEQLTTGKKPEEKKMTTEQKKMAKIGAKSFVDAANSMVKRGEQEDSFAVQKPSFQDPYAHKPFEYRGESNDEWLGAGNVNDARKQVIDYRTKKALAEGLFSDQNSIYYKEAEKARRERMFEGISQESMGGTQFSLSDMHKAIMKADASKIESTDLRNKIAAIENREDYQQRKDAESKSDMGTLAAANRVANLLPGATGTVARGLGAAATAFQHANNTDNVLRARQYYKEADDILNRPDGNENWAYSFVKGVADVATNADTYFAGLLELTNNINDKKLIEKLEKEQELTEDEELLLDAKLAKARAAVLRSGDTAWQYNAGQMAAESVGFMLDFLMTGGISAAAVKATTGRLTKSIMKHYLKKFGEHGMKNVTKNAVRHATTLAEKNIWNKAAQELGEQFVGSAARMPFMSRTYTGIGNAVQKQIDADGNIVEGKTFGEALLDHAIEVWSEASGGMFGVVGKGAGRLISKIPGIRNVSRKALYQSIGNAMRTSNNALEKAGWHGMAGETLEEVLGEGARWLTGLSSDDDIKNFFTEENFETMLLGFLPMTLFGIGSNAAGSLNQYRKLRGKYNESKRDLHDQLAEAGVSEEDIKGCMESMQNSTIEQLQETAMTIINNGQTFEQRRRISEALAKYTGYASAMDCLVSKEGTTEFQREWQGKGLVNSMVRQQSRDMQIAAAFTNNNTELIPALEQWMQENEMSSYEDLLQIDKNSVQYADLMMSMEDAGIRQSIANSINALSNNGVYTTATLSDGSNCYILDGDPNGNASDPVSVAIVSEEDGKIKVETKTVTANDIDSYDSQNAEDVINGIYAQQIAERDAQNFKPGSYVSMTDDNGDALDDVFRVVGMTADGHSVIIADANGGQTTLSASDFMNNFRSTFTVGDAVLQTEAGMWMIDDINPETGTLTVNRVNADGDVVSTEKMTQQKLFDARAEMAANGIEQPTLASQQSKAEIRKKLYDALEADMAASKQQSQAEQQEEKKTETRYVVETPDSTYVVNDIERARRIADEHGIPYDQIEGYEVERYSIGDIIQTADNQRYQVIEGDNEGEFAIENMATGEVRTGYTAEELDKLNADSQAAISKANTKAEKQAGKETKQPSNIKQQIKDAIAQLKAAGLNDIASQLEELDLNNPQPTSVYEYAAQLVGDPKIKFDLDSMLASGNVKRADLEASGLIKRCVKEGGVTLEQLGEQINEQAQSMGIAVDSQGTDGIEAVLEVIGSVNNAQEAKDFILQSRLDAAMDAAKTAEGDREEYERRKNESINNGTIDEAVTTLTRNVGTGNAIEYADSRIASAQKAIDEANAEKVEATEDFAAYNNAITAKNNRISAAQAQLDRWNEIKNKLTSQQQEERKNAPRKKASNPISNTLLNMNAVDAATQLLSQSGNAETVKSYAEQMMAKAQKKTNAKTTTEAELAEVKTAKEEVRKWQDIINAIPEAQTRVAAQMEADAKAKAEDEAVTESMARDYDAQAAAEIDAINAKEEYDIQDAEQALQNDADRQAQMLQDEQDAIEDEKAREEALEEDRKEQQRKKAEATKAAKEKARKNRLDSMQTKVVDTNILAAGQAAQTINNAKAKAKEADALKDVAEALGVKIALRDDMNDFENGSYDAKTKTLNVNVNSKEPLTWLFGHELNHRLQELGQTTGKMGGVEFKDSKAYDAYMKAIKKATPNFDELVRATYEKYNSHGIKTTMKQAAEEVAADRAGDLLRSGKLYEALKGNETLVGRIKDIIQQMIDKLQAAVGLRDADKVNAVNALKDLFAEGKRTARENGDLVTTDNTRFSVVPNNKNLVALHNINAGELMKSMKLGGLPMPSIAITKADMSHEDFGDISLIFDKETINPTDRRNVVWDRDAWTPSFPQVDKKLSEKVVNNIYYKIEKLVPRNTRIGNISLDEDNMNDYLRRADWDAVEAYANNTVMKQAYLAEKGKKIRVPMMTKQYRYDLDMLQQITNVANEAGVDLRDSKVFLDADNNPEYKEVVERIKNIVLDNRIKNNSARIAANPVIEDMLRERYNMSLSEFDSLAYAASQMQDDMKRNNGKIPTVVDTRKAADIINEKVPTDNKKYREWVASLFDGIIEKEGIRNDKDFFTPSGNRRSFEQLHDPVTLHNVVAAMLRENERGGSGFFNSSIFGAIANKVNSIDAIKAQSERIKSVPDAEIQALKDEINNELREITDGVPNSEFGSSLDFMQDLIEAVAKSHDANGIYRALHRYYPRFTKEIAKQVEEVIQKAKNLPTEYFEAKPGRVVGFNEVKIAVVPKGTDKALKDALKEVGAKVVTYDKNIEGNRAEVMQKATEKGNVRFSISSDGEPSQLTINGDIYNVADIENVVRGDVERIISDNDIDAEIVGVKVIGSYMRGEQNADSDLDVLVEYKGRATEDSLFNVISEEALEINGVKIDVNPITKGKSGTIAEFMKRNAGFTKNASAADMEVQDMTDALDAVANAKTPAAIAKAQKAMLDKAMAIEDAHNCVRYSIIGKTGAKNLDLREETTFRIDAVNVAEQMESEGKDAKAIRLATGWERGADGKWRYEIPDLGIEVKNDYSSDMDALVSELFTASGERETEIKAKIDELREQIKNDGNNTYNGKLGDIVDADELFKAYPNLMDVDVMVMTNMGQTEASYNPNGMEIAISDKLLTQSVDRIRSIITHEIQHAIQYAEGFAQGGNLSTGDKIRKKAKAWAIRNELVATAKEKPELKGQWKLAEVLKDEYKEAGLKIDNEDLTKGFNLYVRGYDNEGYEQAYNDWQKAGLSMNNKDFRTYHRLAGEVEARNAQTRLNMSEEERKNTTLAETEDVDREEQIVRYSIGESDVRYSIRTKPAPKKTGIGYKVFYRGKDGKLYPPMVANPNGEDTPVGVWLDADEGKKAPDSKTGRPQVKAGGKGTQGGSGSLAYRPGWHLGEIPYAIQFNRKDENGNKTLFPKDFVWAEVEYAMDVDYQKDAEAEGVNANGKYQHSLAGLKKLPTDGYYKYRTNPNPETDPWIITGAMKVNKVLSQDEVDELVRKAGREPQKVEGVRYSLQLPRDTEGLKKYDQDNGTQISELLKFVELTNNGTERNESIRYDGYFVVGNIGNKVPAYRGLRSNGLQDISGEIRIAKSVFNPDRHTQDDDHRLTKEDWLKSIELFADRTEMPNLLTALREMNSGVYRIYLPVKHHNGQDLMLEVNTFPTRKNSITVTAFGRDAKRVADSLDAYDAARRAGRPVAEREEIPLLIYDNGEMKFLNGGGKNKIRGIQRTLMESANPSSRSEEVPRISGEDTNNFSNNSISVDNSAIQNDSNNRYSIKDDLSNALSDFVKNTEPENVTLDNLTREAFKESNAGSEESIRARKAIKDMLMRHNDIDVKENIEALTSLAQAMLSSRGFKQEDMYMIQAVLNKLKDTPNMTRLRVVEQMKELYDIIAPRQEAAARDTFKTIRNTKVQKLDNSGVMQGKTVDFRTGQLLKYFNNIIDDTTTTNKQEKIASRKEEINNLLNDANANLSKERTEDLEAEFDALDLAEQFLETTGVIQSNIEELGRQRESLDPAVAELVGQITSLKNEQKRLVAELGFKNAKDTEEYKSLAEQIKSLQDQKRRTANSPSISEGLQQKLDENMAAIKECERKRDEAGTDTEKNNWSHQIYTLRKERTNLIAKKKAEKDAVIQQYEAIDDMIRQTKSELIDSYDAISSQLRDLIDNGRSAFRERQKRIREHKKQIAHFAMSDLKGVTPVGNEKNEYTNFDSAYNFFANPTRTFMTELKKWARHAPNGEGYLYDHFARGFVDARHTMLNGTRDAIDKMDAISKQLFDASYETVTAQSKMPLGMTISYNEHDTEDLSIGQAMMLYMWNKQKDSEIKLRQMGIDEEVMDKITQKLEEVADGKWIKLADYIQHDFLVQAREKYNETYIQQFGTSMAAIENYFPIKIAKEQRQGGQEQALDPDFNSAMEFGKFVETKVGSIKNRTYNKLGLDIRNNDALDILNKHIMDMEWWNAMSPLANDVNTLLANKTFCNKIDALSKGSTQRLSQDLAKILVGKYSDAKNGEGPLVTLMKYAQRAKIGFRGWTAIKQLASFPAFAADRDINPAKLILAVSTGHADIHRQSNFDWAMEHLPMFRERYNSALAGNISLESNSINKSKFSRAVDKATKLGMWANKKIDTYTCAAGARLKYEGAKARYLRYGLSEEEAEHRAIQDAEILYNESQQSAEGLFVSQMQKSRGFINSTLSAFQNSQMGYTRKVIEGVRQLEKEGFFDKEKRQQMLDFSTKKWARQFGWKELPETTEGLTEEELNEYMQQQQINNDAMERARTIAAEELSSNRKQAIANITVYGYVIGAVWKMMSVAPQWALALLPGGDDDDKKLANSKMVDAMIGGGDAALQGFSGGATIDAIYSMAIEWARHGKDFDIERALGGSSSLYVQDLVKESKAIYNAWGEDIPLLLSHTANLIAETVGGVDMNTFSNIVFGFADLCTDTFGNKKITAQDIALDLSRMLCMPNSQLKAIGLAPKSQEDLNSREWFKRYKEWKMREQYGLFYYMAGEPTGADVDKMEKSAKKFLTERQEQLNEINNR